MDAEAQQPILVRYRLRAQALRHAIKVTTFGGLGGTAGIFPVVNPGPSWVRITTLVIFTICAFGFGALHHATFVEFPGPAVVILLMLCGAVLSGRTNPTELAPYLPLVFLTLAVFTVVGNDVWQRYGRSWCASFTRDVWQRSGRPWFASFPRDARPPASDSRWSGRSYQSSSSEPDSEPPMEPEWQGHLPLDRYESRPLSRVSCRTAATETSSISLSGAAAPYRPDWDPQTRSFLDQDSPLPRQGAGEEPQAGGGFDAWSDRGTAHSSDLLLGARGGGPRP